MALCKGKDVVHNVRTAGGGEGGIAPEEGIMLTMNTPNSLC